MTDKKNEVDATYDVIEQLLVNALFALRESRTSDAMLLLQEARTRAERLPKKDKP